jgi:hypothetical protein
MTPHQNLQELFNGLPWSSLHQWQEINTSIQILSHIHRFEFNRQLKPVIEQITNQLISINNLLDHLSQVSCPRCPAPCCLSAKIWFDLKDLLFMHLREAAFPVSQPLSQSTDTCRYLRPKGCALPRIIRPWICTWYLCPTQMAIIRSGREPVFKTLPPQISALKILRNRLEDRFIDIAA